VVVYCNCRPIRRMSVPRQLRWRQIRESGKLEDPTCRWIAYAGGPVYLEEVLSKPKHSLIDQSLAACAGETTTNGDGFGVGWYGNGQAPGLYKGHTARLERREPLGPCLTDQIADVHGSCALHDWSAPIVTPSAMGVGCFSTMAPSPIFLRSSAISCSRYRRVCFPKSPGAQIRRSCSFLR
jgi:hypothetical protein